MVVRLGRIFRHSNMRPRVRETTSVQVNTAPSLTGDATLASVLQNNTNPPGSAIETLFASLFSDPDPLSSMLGVAVVANAANAGTQGKWQFLGNSTQSVVWPLDESSGDRVPIVGTSTLTDNNTVASAVGMFGNAADFTAANGESLSCADSPEVSLGDIDCTIRFWVKFKTLPATDAPSFGLVTKWGASGEYAVELANYSWDVGTPQIYFWTRAADDSADNNAPQTAFSFSTGVWYLVHAWHDSVNNVIGVSVNAGAANTLVTAGVRDSTNQFNLGAWEGGPYLDGYLDDVVFTNHMMTEAERTADYNGGAGAAWPVSTSGNWIDIGTVADGTTARVLSASTLVRFLPVSTYSGTPPSLVVRALDNTYAGGFSSSIVRVNVYTLMNGGSTAIAATPRNIATLIPAPGPPLIALSGGSTVATAQVAIAIDSGLTLSDADSPTQAWATVSITGNYQSGQDVLTFTNVSGMGNVVETSNASGVLTLTSAGATATLAQWQAALRVVKYTNSSATPNTGNRTVEFVINDGNLDSLTVSKTVAVTTPSGMLANPSFTPGWASYGMVQQEGELPAGQSFVQVGYATQTDIFATWPDGSFKHGMITFKPTVTGAIAVSSGSPAGGTFTPTIPTASVQVIIGGTTYTATMPTSVNTSDRCLNGAHVQEWRHKVTPLNGGTPHPFMRCTFNCRVYSDGQARVEVRTDNCLSSPTSNIVTCDIVVTVNGSIVLSQVGVVMGFTTGWRRLYNVGLTESIVTHDFEPFYAAKAIPRYSSTVSNSVWDLNNTAYKFDLMGRGGIQYNDMGSPGARTDLAPFPDYCAHYLVHQSASQRAFVLAAAQQAAAWPCHLRWHTAEELPKVTDHPQIWLDYRQMSSPAAPVGDRIQCANAGNTSTDALKVGRGPLTFDLQHVPQLLLVAYLTTGDQFYADEMAYWANGVMLIGRGYRNGGAGLVMNVRQRGIAWCLRIMAEAAAFLPDAHELKTYLATCVQNNLDYIDSVVAGDVDNQYLQWYHPSGTLPTSFEVYDQDAFPTLRPTGYLLYIVWQMHYFMYSIARCNHLGFVGGLSQLDLMMDMHVLMLTSTGSGYPSDAAACNFLVTGSYNISAGIGNYTPTYLASTMGELYTLNNTEPYKSRSGFGQYSTHWGFYARSLWSASVLSVYHGAANSAAAQSEFNVRRAQYNAFVQAGFNFAASMY